MVQPDLTLEAMAIRVADRIAYVNHDLDDCLRAGVLQQAELPAEVMATLGFRHSQRVGRMVNDLIENSLDQPHLAMSAEILEATDALKRFLWDNVYQRPELQAECSKVTGIIAGLFGLYMRDDQALFEAVGLVPTDRQRRARLVCDYIAGMTDRFARAQYVKHFLPSAYPF